MAVVLAQQLATYCGMLMMMTMMFDEDDDSDDDYGNNEHKWQRRTCKN